jgi:hypothetical protein
MEKCFVIQPFDRDKFDKRYVDIFEPAIKGAKLEPYRVDRDPSVTIPIETIEEGIRGARICFAEISTDNPNVWYELGFAFASHKDVVMVCATDERVGKFPFDIQHKTIVTYGTSSKSDFEKLEVEITKKLVALGQKKRVVENIVNHPQIVSGDLESHELAMLLLILESQFTDQDSISLSLLKDAMINQKFTSAAISLAIRSLVKKDYIVTVVEIEGYNSEYSYSACKLTPHGEDWLMKNQHLISIHSTERDIAKTKGVVIDSDDLPF